jgi:GABA permease
MNRFLHSEARALRIITLTVGACIAVALVERAGGELVDALVLMVVTVAVLARLLAAPRPTRSTAQAPPRPPSARHRIVIVATATDLGELAHDVRARAAEHDSDVVLICPALNTRLAHWVSDVDAAERAAQRRVDLGLEALVGAGVDARGEIGDPDPLQAIQDALWVHGADLLILATSPHGELHWLERRLVERARERYLMPIEHLGDLPKPEPAEPEFAPVGARLAEVMLLATAPDSARRPPRI